MKRSFTKLLVRNYSELRPLRFLSGSATLPDPTKTTRRGEDSLFVLDTTIGVADGVGGWSREGVDAGEYSRQLMKHAAAIAREGNRQEGTYSTVLCSPGTILSTAFTKVQALGSTTACIIQINGTKLLAANLGDSGFRICRNENVLHFGKQQGAWNVLCRSKDQLHGFNCPLQLGHDSDDKPSDANLTSFEVMPGDIIVAATDGLYDNLYDREITRLIAKHYNENSLRCMQSLAEQIAISAQRVAKCTKSETPFAVAARKAGHRWIGGKLDDITVITSLVV